MQNKLNLLMTGAVGGGTVHLINGVQLPTTGELKDIVSIAVQIAVGIATIISIIKKKSKISE